VRLVVFSDLDGTLLDHHDYAWSAARPALSALRAAGGALVLCSSKTSAEMIVLHGEMGLSEPLVAENGGGIFAPEAHPLAAGPGWRPAEPGWRVLALGLGVDEVRARLARFNGPFGARGFGQMSVAEVAGLTGLSPARAALARRRRFNEPLILPRPEEQAESFIAAARAHGLAVTRGGRFFHLLGGGDKGAALARRRRFNEPLILPRPEEQAESFIAAARAHGLAVTRGGRFFHLLGGGDKGAAVARLIDYYKGGPEEIRTMALGDAPNDASMLRAVDWPVLLARPDGSHAAVDAPGLALQPLPGPRGWNRAVLAALEELAP